MFARLVRPIVLLILLLAETTQAESGKTLSITFDDLPWTSLPKQAPPDLLERHQALVRSLRAARVPAVGFVNESKLYQGHERVPARVQMLRDWLDAGLALGNHTRDHVDLHTMSLAEYQRNILAGESVLRPLLAEYGQAPLWFRHPYLHAGQSASIRADLAAFLETHDYQIAPVTIDNSEWIYAKAYHDCVRRPECPAGMRTRLIQSYVPYMRDKIRYYEAQSERFFGRQIAQVLLLHANELNAACLDQLLTMLTDAGYQFVPLATALKDPVYQREVGYDGPAGPSWIHRWAMAMDFKGADFAGEPLVPAWVLAEAGLERE